MRRKAVRRALKLPVALYAVGAGWLLGHRFLLLTHRGRRSGRLHRTVLEVLSWDPQRREAIVMSGFGPRANWLLNVQRPEGAVEVAIGRTRFEPVVHLLTPEEAMRVVESYERGSRLGRLILRAASSRLAEHRYDGSPSGRRRLVEELPLLAFRDERAPAA